MVCVQNDYNLAHRADDALIDELAAKGIAYVPFFPLGGFTPLQSIALSDVAQRWGQRRCRSRSRGCCTARRTFFSSRARPSTGHLHENLKAAELTLSDDVLDQLNAIGGAGNGKA